MGSSYLPSEMNVAYLYAQLENAEMINENRLKNWNLYYENLKFLEKNEQFKMPKVPEGCIHNAHMFYIKCQNLKERSKLIEYLQQNGISSVFHYVPLHSSDAGKKFGIFSGKDNYTTLESEKLLRLPMYYGLKEEEILYICEKIKIFFK
jgi:dTDP-4-amino-4,6-dideoxygalactose transaminase